jgi:hypothetical protein
VNAKRTTRSSPWRTALAGYDDYSRNYGLPLPQPAAIDVARVASAVGLDEVAEQVVTRDLVGREAEAREPARGSDFGDVVLVIENGFIAYKREQKLFVPILKSERDAVVSGGAGAALAAAFNVMVRTVIIMTEMSREGQDYVQAHEDGVTFVSGALSAVGLELITMAWATYEPGTRRASGIRVSGPDGGSWTPAVMEDLSAIAVRDFEERKTSMLVRMTARTLLKEAGVIQSERAGERAGGVLGGLAARVAARTVANATERADTRSWSGLPAELLLTRLRLPPGRHDLVVEYRGMNGPATKTVTVDVVAGSVSLATVAVAGRDDWDRDRLRRAHGNVRYSVPPRSGRTTPGRD